MFKRRAAAAIDPRVDTIFEIGGQERAGSGLEWPGAQHLAEFRLDSGLPVWRYELGATVVEKRVHMLHQQNTVHVTYHLIHGGPVRIKLRPALHVRPLEGSVHGAIDEPYTITAIEDRLELSTARGYPPLRLKVYGRRATFALDSGKLDNVHYRAEAQGHIEQANIALGELHTRLAKLSRAVGLG